MTLPLFATTRSGSFIHMKIRNIEGLAATDFEQEVANGARFVFYSYCISLLVVTLRRPSDVYFIPAGQRRSSKGWPFTTLSLVLGWWGIPWGPVYTVSSIGSNLNGGKDVTEEVMATVAGHLLFEEVQQTRSTPKH